MIAVKIDPRCSEIMRQLPIAEAEVVTTVNERHRGLLDDGYTRIVAIHWFSETRIVMVESVVTKKRQEGSYLYFDEVMVSLAILLRRSLPSGSVTRDNQMPGILAVVAESFGFPLRFHHAQPYAMLYGGPWDGSPPSIKSEVSFGDALLLATLDPEQHTAKLAWAFDLNRYLLWLSQQP